MILENDWTPIRKREKSYPASLYAVAISSSSRLTAKRCRLEIKKLLNNFDQLLLTFPPHQNIYLQDLGGFTHSGMRSRMERNRLTLFWGLMLGLSSCLRPATAESK